MAVGLGVLRLAPNDFWAMTPREFAAAAGLLARHAASPSRRALDAMMQVFPDRRGE